MMFAKVSCNLDFKTLKLFIKIVLHYITFEFWKTDLEVFLMYTIFIANCFLIQSNYHKNLEKNIIAEFINADEFILLNWTLLSLSHLLWLSRLYGCDLHQNVPQWNGHLWFILYVISELTNQNSESNTSLQSYTTSRPEGAQTIILEVGHGFFSLSRCRQKATWREGRFQGKSDNPSSFLIDTKLILK